MTSSWALSKRKERPDIWGVGNLTESVSENSPLGGWEDHYVTPGHTHECHPDFKAIPIGNPYGFMMCVRKKASQLNECRGYARIGGSVPDPQKLNGVVRFSNDLYDPRRIQPRQDFNPTPIAQRQGLDPRRAAIPNLQYLIENDYIYRPFNYNGTGIGPAFATEGTPNPNIPSPPYTRDGEGRFPSYAYSALRNPPYKFDITRLEQPYPVWREEKKRLGILSDEGADMIDQAHVTRRA